jgi:hypothetical protein
VVPDNPVSLLMPVRLGWLIRETAPFLQGTGGCRKFRFAKEGGGKSGGYRVVTWFGGGDVPVFLLTVFAKGRQATLTPDERNGLARITAALKRARKQS